MVESYRCCFATFTFQMWALQFPLRGVYTLALLKFFTVILEINAHSKTKLSRAKYVKYCFDTDVKYLIIFRHWTLSFIVTSMDSRLWWNRSNIWKMDLITKLALYKLHTDGVRLILIDDDSESLKCKFAKLWQ